MFKTYFLRYFGALIILAGLYLTVSLGRPMVDHEIRAIGLAGMTIAIFGVYMVCKSID